MSTQEKTVDNLMEEYVRTRDINARNELLQHYLYIAEIIARKFIGRGVEYDDLYQVASLALIKAIERFDPGRGLKFSTFATPTLVGEVKNYFRDRSRLIRLPRRSANMMRRIEEARDVQAQKLGRMPTVGEIAEELGESEEAVLESMEVGAAAHPMSLDVAVVGDQEMDISQVIGQEEEDYDKIEYRDFLTRILGGLNETERWIIEQRYLKGRSQREVAQDIGVSQMYVSRLERKILSGIRKQVGVG